MNRTEALDSAHKFVNQIVGGGLSVTAEKRVGLILDVANFLIDDEPELTECLPTPERFPDHPGVTDWLKSTEAQLHQGMWVAVSADGRFLAEGTSSDSLWQYLPANWQTMSISIFYIRPRSVTLG